MISTHIKVSINNIHININNVNNNDNINGKKKHIGVPFVVTYHPSLNCLHKIIRGNIYLLYMTEEVKNLFLPGPMVSLRGARKLSRYLVRAKLYPLHRKIGSKTCKERQKQYIGETTYGFRYRWNNYKSSSRKFDRKESCMQEHLYRQFSSPGYRGFLNDVSLL